MSTLLPDLEHELLGAARRTHPTVAPTVRRRRRRWAMPAGGLALAGAVAAAIALTSGADSGHIAPPPATAAEALRRVAAVAAQAPAPVPRDDQFYYVKSQGTGLGMREGKPPVVFLQTSEREIWTSVDRPGRLIDKPVASKQLSPADPTAELSPNPYAPGDQGSHMTIAASHHYFIGDEELSRTELLAFPVDPPTLFDRLLARVGNRGHSPNGEVFTEIGDALRESPAPPALRAGLYRALALIPGIELVGTATDRMGRVGTAVAFTEVGIRHELIFDPDTSELLAERSLLLDPAKAGIPVPAGTVTGDTVYLRRAVTDDLRQP